MIKHKLEITFDSELYLNEFLGVLVPMPRNLIGICTKKLKIQRVNELKVSRKILLDFLVLN